MTRFRLLLLFFSFTIITSAQKYEPQIVILTPDKTGFDKKLEIEISRLNASLKARSKQPELEQVMQSEEFNDQPENIKKMTLSQIAFTQRDLFGSISVMAQNYLSYRFVERLPNLLITLSNEKSDGTIRQLEAIADKAGMQYVLNFPSVDLYTSGHETFAKIKVQLYDRETKDMLINEMFEGDWHNPGLEFSCQDKTISCTINNALSSSMTKVVQVVLANSPTLKFQRQLSRNRYDELISNQFVRAYDKAMITSILKDVRFSYKADNIYQVLFDQTKSKFVAFSLEKSDRKTLKAMSEDGDDLFTRVEISGDFRDKGVLEKVPRMYAYIIKAVKYKGEWFIAKDHVTRFESASIEDARKKYFNNLQQWNFFSENSVIADPNFWEGMLFEIVPDLTKDPKWERYKDTMWKQEELMNREYIGLYKLVADELRKRKQH